MWIPAGCFDNTRVISGGGNATCIGLWGAAWYNRIMGNVCTTRQYGITVGCVSLGRPASPHGPSFANTINNNTIAATWRTRTTPFEDKSVGAIGFCSIGDGVLLEGRLFLGNTITHNTISWTGKWPIRLRRDHGTYVAFNRVSDEHATFYLDHTTAALFKENRTMAGALIGRTKTNGPCTFRFLDAPERRPRRDAAGP